MKLKNYHVVINIIILLWTFTWVYYLAFNWSVFSILLQTNLGFAVIKGYPFLFFFIFGLLLLAILKYSYQLTAIHQKNHEKEEKNKIVLLEKDIEILKLKEVLFQMQTKDLSESSSALNALQKKLDSISNQITGKETDNNTDEKDKEQKDKPDTKN